MAWIAAEEARVKAIEKQMATLVGVLETLDKDLKTKIDTSDLLNSEAALTRERLDNSEAIAKLQEKLATIVLPEDTRYYLEASEVDQFRANFNQLQAMLAEVNRLYKNIVAYTAKYAT